MTGKKRTTWLVVLGLLIAAGGAVAVPVRTQYQAWRAERAYRKGDGDAKRGALRELGKLATRRSRRVIREALVDPMPMARNAAAHAVFMGRYTDLAEDLWGAMQREADSRVRGSMIVAWAQVVGEPARERLRGLAQSSDPCVRLGAARGLLRVGDLAAARDVFVLAASGDRFLRRDAQRELLSLAQPMGQMIGQPIGVPDVRPGRWSQQQVEELQAWWQVHATPRLLHDYLVWRYDKPLSWKRVEQVLREWRTNAPGFLRSAEEEGEES